MPHPAEIPSLVRDVLGQLPDPAAHVDAAPMLPAECYTAPEFFAFEEHHVFSRTWNCIGRMEQIPEAGDYLFVRVADEPVLVVRQEDGGIAAMSAVCQHRGQVITAESGSTGKFFQCPLHFWSYDLAGRFVGGPRIDDEETVACLRESVQLPPVQLEVWHGFLFVNLDPDAAPLAPSLAKVEPFWAGYDDADLVAVPPKMAEEPLPWNWKVHAENFTDAYHPEFVHRGTHDFAPSVHPDGGVVFTPMAAGDNAIVRSVPLLGTDGGMMEDGWGASAEFPAIDSLSEAQRNRVTFVMIPPSMTLIFAPGAVSYQLLSAQGVRETFASNDRVTAGGWLLPRSTLEQDDFDARAAAVRAGAKKIWVQDIPVNLGVQEGKGSRYLAQARYMPLEKTLVQFNAWLLRVYTEARDAALPTEPGR